MKHIFTYIALGAALLIGSQWAEAAQFGYTNGEIGRTWVYRLGIKTDQGQAIRIPKEKLALMRGCTIDEISVVFASRQTTDKKAKLFITTDLSATPAVEQEVTISRALDWLSYELDNKYTITGEEEALYIGYTAEIAISGQLYHSDLTQELPETCFAMSNGNWIDTYGTGHGMASIRFSTSDVNVTDCIMKPLDVDAYFKAKNKYDFQGQVLNFGTEPIKSFDIKVSIGDEAPSVIEVRDVNVLQGQNYDFTVKDFEAAVPGLADVAFEIVNINGGVDQDPADNGIFRSIYFYPEDMKRSFLLECFTGQDCSNCPRGHGDVHNFLAANPDLSFVEIMHHSGYNPDIFSMDADYDCTFFYGSNSTFAPGFTLNRSAIPGQQPVQATSSSALNAALQNVVNTQPYVSLDLTTEFDQESRKLKVTLTSYTHNTLPEGTNILNVWLTQDGLVGYQSGGGDNYVHNAVSRGVITGNSWGIQLPAEACQSGGWYTYETELEIPEAIYSDFWKGNYEPTDKSKYTIATDPEKMKVVAYVGAFGSTSDATKHPVYNAIAAPLTGGHETQIPAGVESVEIEIPAINVYALGGEIVIDGYYDTAEVYTLGGARAPLSGLSKGIYVVKVTTNGKSIVKKVFVK